MKSGHPGVLEPAQAVWERLSLRIAAEAGTAPLPAVARSQAPEWDEVSPGVFCHVLSTDFRANRISMLVWLQPGIGYPLHQRAGVEELHLLDGELWINDRKLLAGDYNRVEAGSEGRRAWSETGCTCVLITSARDWFTERPVL